MRSTLMGHSLRKLVAFGLILAALATTVGVGPAVAGTVPPDYGSSVTCRYRTNSPGPAYEAKLRRIVVAPPLMFSRGGQQRVGWRFVVRRTIDAFWPDYPSHHVTYRSPIQTAKATTADAADFETMDVGVALPTTVEDPFDVHYQVVIKMLWYRPDGRVKSTISHLMTEYSVRIKGKGWVSRESGYERCDGGLGVST